MADGDSIWNQDSKLKIAQERVRRQEIEMVRSLDVETPPRLTSLPPLFKLQHAYAIEADSVGVLDALSSIRME